MTTERPVWARLAELRSVAERSMEIHQRELDSGIASFRNSVQSTKLRSEQTNVEQVKVVKLKAQLREVEDDLVKSLAAKTRREAKRMTIVDSISVTKAKEEELHRVLKDQSDRKNKYANLLSQQLEAITECKEKVEQDSVNVEEMKGVYAWYNDTLGLYIEGGHGVRFTFTKLDKKHPLEKYTFSVRLANNVYTLIDCNPQLDGIEELVHELNKSNGLFKFVRTMRAMFQEYAGSGQPGSAHLLTYPHQEAVELSIAAPVISTDSASNSHAMFSESNRDINKPSLARGAESSRTRLLGRPGSAQLLTSPHQDAVELPLAAPMVSTDSTSDSHLRFKQSNRDVQKSTLARGSKPSVESPAFASLSSRRKSPR